MSYRMYRLTVNGKETHHDTCPSETWSRIADACEARGGVQAKLERRLISFDDCTALFPCIEATDANGTPIWISDWTIIAELDSYKIDEYPAQRISDQLLRQARAA